MLEFLHNSIDEAHLVCLQSKAAIEDTKRMLRLADDMASALLRGGERE